MEKNTKIALAIILIAVAMFFLLNKNDSILSANLYDSEGNLIKNSLSVINGVGIYSVSFNVIANNEGNVPLTCDIKDANPIQLYNALNKSSKIAPVNSGAYWTSDVILLSQFEDLPQPINFNVTLNCRYKENEQIINLPDKTGEVSINIQKEINFRTSDLDYSSHGAIAYGSCNGDLKAYGDQSGTCWTTTSETCPTRSGYTLKLTNIPGSPLASASPGCLYTLNSDSTRIAVAFKKTGTAGRRCTCSIQGQWCVYIFDSDDPDSSNVGTSLTKIDETKEVSC